MTYFTHYTYMQRIPLSPNQRAMNRINPTAALSVKHVRVLWTCDIYRLAFGAYVAIIGDAG